MINPSELRINNIFKEKYSGKIIKVIGLELKRTVFDFQTLEKWQAEPIPLTEDLLVNLGFELKNQWFDYELDGFRLGYITDDTNFQFETSSNKVIDVKSLHHLQNLYFFNNLKELDASKII